MLRLALQSREVSRCYYTLKRLSPPLLAMAPATVRQGLQLPFTASQCAGLLRRRCASAPTRPSRRPSRVHALAMMPAPVRYVSRGRQSWVALTRYWRRVWRCHRCSLPPLARSVACSARICLWNVHRSESAPQSKIPTGTPSLGANASKMAFLTAMTTSQFIA